MAKIDVLQLASRLWKTYDNFGKATGPMKDLQGYVAYMEKQFAGNSTSNPWYHHCSDENIKTLYLITRAMSKKLIEPEWEERKNAAQWRKELSKGIWKRNALKGYGEFGPELAPGETDREYHRRRTLGAKNALHDVNEALDLLWALEEVFDALEFGKGEIVYVGTLEMMKSMSTVGAACGGLVDRISKVAKGGRTRVEKVLKSMQDLVPSLEEITNTPAPSINSRGNNSKNTRHTQKKGLGVLRQRNLLGRCHGRNIG